MFELISGQSIIIIIINNNNNNNNLRSKLS
jgi:hypothetical protein